MTLEAVIKKANELVTQTKAKNTKTAYQSDLKQFAKWCIKNDLMPFPCTSEILTAYLVDKSDDGRAVSTLARAVTAISQAHKLSGFSNPVDTQVREVMKAIRRVRGIAQTRARPLTKKQLLRVNDCLGPSIRDRRDCALLTLGWTCALRRAELVALNGGDVESCDGGLIVHIRRGKTDQEGEGRKIGVPFAGPQSAFCPVFVIRRWITMARCAPEDPLFFRLTKKDNRSFLKGCEIFSIPKHKKRLSDKAVARIIKKSLETAGYDNTGYSGHSLRSGFCTEAAAAGVTERVIMGHTGHKSAKVMRTYIRDGSLFSPENPLGILFALGGPEDPEDPELPEHDPENT